MEESQESGGFVNVERPAGQGQGMERSSSIGSDVEGPPSEEDLLRILECPVCTEFPSPPIYTCTQGHFVCSDCIKLLNICTQCNSPFTKGRNYAVEAIVERTKFKCKYGKEGCDQVVTGQEYGKHVQQCPFRPFHCDEVSEDGPDGDIRPAGCQGEFNKEDYVKHLTETHGADGSDNHRSGRLLQKLGESFPIGYLKIDDNYFLVHTRKYKSFVCWWVSTTSPPNEGKMATLTWWKPSSEGGGHVRPPFLIKWNVPINHENKTFEEIRDSGACAVLPSQHLEQLRNREDSSDTLSWVLQFDINNLNEDGLEGRNDLAGALFNTFWHYLPLVALSVIGFLAYHYCKKQEEYHHAKQHEENLYGYRGFYYTERPRHREF